MAVELVESFDIQEAICYQLHGINVWIVNIQS